MVEHVITGIGVKENRLVMPKRFFHALIMSHFYLPCLADRLPVWVLEREIKDIRIDGDSVIVVYEEEAGAE